MTKGLEQQCQGPQRVRWRREAKRLRHGLAPDTGSPLDYNLFLGKETTAEGIKLTVMQFLLDAIGQGPPASSTAQVAAVPITLTRRRMMAKTGPYGRWDCPKGRCTGKRPPFSAWHLYNVYVPDHMVDMDREHRGHMDGGGRDSR